MKARIKGSNEPFKEIELVTFAGSTYVDDLYNVSVRDLEFEQEHNISDHWQDIRERAAIAAMQGYMSCKCQLVGTINLAMAEGIAEQAILIADALVKKLKGE